MFFVLLISFELVIILSFVCNFFFKFMALNVRFVKEFTKENKIGNIYKQTKYNVFMRDVTFFLVFQILINGNIYNGSYNHLYYL